MLATALAIVSAAAAAGRVVGVVLPHVPDLPSLEGLSPAMHNATHVARQQLAGLQQMVADVKAVAGEDGMPSELEAALNGVIHGRDPAALSARGGVPDVELTV